MECRTVKGRTGLGFFGWLVVVGVVPFVGCSFPWAENGLGAKFRPGGELAAVSRTSTPSPVPDPFLRMMSERTVPPSPPALAIADAASVRTKAQAVGAPMRGVIHVDKATFEQHVLQAETPVLVDFYASWCGPCKALAPTLDEVAAESPQARVVKINVDDSPELAARYGVTSIPSLMLFKDGRVVAKQKGATSKTRLLAMLEQ